MQSNMSFYPDVKPHISPSAFATWHNQRSLFIRSYFKGEKTPETTAMRDGTKIHGLIEGGFLPVINDFEFHEETLEVMIGDKIKVLGIPDSHEVAEKETVTFVDYKTGKKQTWTANKIASDKKMLLTAWLVLQANPHAKNVRAVIEWIGTEWNGAELVPTGESECIEHVFDWATLFEVPAIIEKTVAEINLEYEKFLESSEEEIVSLVEESDIHEYVKLEEAKQEIETRQKEIRERIGEQLEVSGQKNFEHPHGTFYFTERKVYEFPEDLSGTMEDGTVVTPEFATKVSSALTAAQNNWKLSNEPKSISKSLSFRAKKRKK